MGKKPNIDSELTRLLTEGLAKLNSRLDVIEAEQKRIWKTLDPINNDYKKAVEKRENEHKEQIKQQIKDGFKL